MIRPLLVVKDCRGREHAFRPEDVTYVMPCDWYTADGAKFRCCLWLRGDGTGTKQVIHMAESSTEVIALVNAALAGPSGDEGPPPEPPSSWRDSPGLL